MIELTTWFRSAIWFLAFTSATTLSPGWFLVAAALGLVFELVYNITNARTLWWAMMDMIKAMMDMIRAMVDMIRAISTMLMTEIKLTKITTR